jgi:thioesterase domain-containing protein
MRRTLGRLIQRMTSRLIRALQRGEAATTAPSLVHEYGLDRPDLPELYKQRLEWSLRAFRTFRPEVYRGDALVIRSKVRPLLHFAQPDLGWGRWIDGRLRVATVPGHHHSLFGDVEIDDVAQEFLAIRDRQRDVVNESAGQ